MIKDWKKTTEGQILTEYENIKTRFLVSIVKLKQRIVRYNVEIYNPNKIKNRTSILNKKPLTKQQALKFAKSYMRKH